MTRKGNLSRHFVRTICEKNFKYFKWYGLFNLIVNVCSQLNRPYFTFNELNKNTIHSSNENSFSIFFIVSDYCSKEDTLGEMTWQMKRGLQTLGYRDIYT